MKKLIIYLTAAAMFLLFAATAMSDEIIKDKKNEKESNFYSLTANFEMGFLAVADHRVQFSQDGTYIDYKSDGAQDVLFPVMRMSLDLVLAENHRITFLYQPLELKTQNNIPRELKIDGESFVAGTPVEFLYSFPFYRISYAYDIIKGPKHTVAFGASLQIRNATISFLNLDGTQMVSKRDIGPVPVLKFYWKTKLGHGFWVGAEIDGFYAPISYLNGSDQEVVGAIVDASIRGGIELGDRAEMFLNLRYIAGGAIGSSDDSTGDGDGFVRNWLHFLTVTAGFTFRLI